MDQKNCWFKKTCKLGKCDEPICMRYEHMLDMLRRSGLSENEDIRYPIVLNSDSFAYQTLEKIRKDELGDWYKDFHSLYIWSTNYLNCKTTYAKRLLIKYFMLFVDYNFNEYPCGVFVTIQQLKDLFIDQVKSPEEYKEKLNDLINCELLVVDDVEKVIGNQKLEQFLGNILNTRYEHKKSVIYTSHLSPDAFEERCEDKFLNSRIVTLSKFIQFNAEPYRGGKV